MNIGSLIRLFQFRSRPARTKRYEILLPLTYNDGASSFSASTTQAAFAFADGYVHFPAVMTNLLTHIALVTRAGCVAVYGRLRRKSHAQPPCGARHPTKTKPRRPCPTQLHGP